MCTYSEGTPPPPPPPPPHLHLPWGQNCIVKHNCTESLGLHQNSTSHGLLWSLVLISQLTTVHISPPPPMGSYGLHLVILRNPEPSLELHLPWPPMVSTTKISVNYCPSFTSTSHGLLWSPPCHTQKVNIVLIKNLS